ncbi:MAG: hypothetical protein HDR00_05640 [Lachnospiraceae bacterium]|nr:hypothetical protein [Lachnospiraceae bacterium]
MINKKGTEQINLLSRVDSLQEASNRKEDVLLLPTDVDVAMLENFKVQTIGLGSKLDEKTRDLLRIIDIIDPINVKYSETNVLSPRTFAESLTPIPQHMSIQCILLTKVQENDIQDIVNLIKKTSYGRTEYDNIWVSKETSYKDIKDGSLLYIMNRRVGGWDGSIERPVIELLGAGGHVGVDDNLVMIAPIDVVISEIHEEIGIEIAPSQVKIFGGFHNKISNELVILCGAFLPSNKIVSIQEYALNNYEQDTDGIYLGFLQDVMNLYLENAAPFAGGEKAKPSNFPSQLDLMKKVYEYEV